MTPMWELARFDLAHHVRQRATWFYAAVFLGLGGLAITTFATNTRGSVFDAPLAVAGTIVITSMLGMLITAALAGDAATRDAQTRIAPLLHAGPITRTAYLGGRFLGMFALNALLLAAVPAGILLATLLRAGDAELVRAIRPSAYIAPYFVLALPNAFVTMALLYALAVLNRGAVAAYAGALVLFLGTMVIEGVLAEAMGHWELAKVLDPFGIVLMRELVRTWTPAQKDTLLVGLEGALLANRVLWLAIASAALAITRWRYSPQPAMRRRASLFRFHSRAASVSAESSASAPRPAIAVPQVQRRFDATTRMRQTLDIAWRSFRTIVTGRGAFVLAFPAVFMVLFGPQLLRHFGTPLLPTTGQILGILVDSGDIFLAVAAPFLIVVYAGELVWREREAHLNDIVDATPLPDWVPLLGKFLGLSLVLVLLQALAMLAGIVLQTGLGDAPIEIGLYLGVLFGLQLSEYLLFAVLALAVHVLVNQKYAGHLVVLLAYAFTIFAVELGLEHHLLIYGSDPGWTYSDMRGLGPFLAPLLWFKFYWAGWALLLAVAAQLFWVRGRDHGFERRALLARRRFTGVAIGAMATGMGLVLTLGGLIFYNTNVLNAYTTASERMERRAGYERRYGQYRGIPQPELTGARLHVELHPSRRAVDVSGTFDLTNRTGAPIESVHVVTPAEATVRTMAFEGTPSTSLDDGEGFGHRIYALERPLQPGETVALRFDVQYEPRGFTNRRVDPPVAGNGTYFGRHWLPAIGYQSGREVQGDAERRAHGLPARPDVPPLDDGAARLDVSGAERLTFEAVVGTDEGQVAVAPGALRRTWTEGGRRYFHYVADAPIRNDYAFFSAEYGVRDAQWTDAASGREVAIQILHHPGHTANLDRMVWSVQASLDNYARHFGPYPYGQIRLVEHPGDGNSLHSAPINISYEEGFSLMDPEQDPRGLDFPFAVVAHEVAHQWWGNQVTPAFMEGGPLVTESLAWYSAMAVVDEALGRRQLDRLLGMMREAYLVPQPRGAAPLLRAHDWFLVYRKGPFALYALREYAGAERVNAALRRLLEKHGAGRPPLPTSRDLYEELEAALPESLHALLQDLFATNTSWEFVTDRVTAEPVEGGEWQVTMEAKARKVMVDGDGVETERAMDDLVEVGVFAESGEPLYLRMHRIRSGTQRVTVTVPARPARAGLDPRHLLIDMQPDDNTAPVGRRE